MILIASFVVFVIDSVLTAAGALLGALLDWKGLLHRKNRKRAWIRTAGPTPFFCFHKKCPASVPVFVQFALDMYEFLCNNIHMKRA